MRKYSFLKTSILALAGVFFTHSVQAQATGNQPVSLSDNDLLMGFRATVTPGLTTNLELNLGNADAYYNPTGAATFATIAPVVVTNIGHLSATDLQNTYQNGTVTNWATRTDLFWGIAGTSSASGSFDGIFGQNTIYLTRPETTVGVRTTPWNRQVNFAAANVQISSLGGAGGYAGTSTATSDYDLLINAGNINSYQSRSSNAQGQTFAAVNGAFVNDSVVATFGTGTWISVEDLFALEPGTGAGVYLGSFGLAANGRMDYSPTASYFAVPEPAAATYLLVVCAASAFRRRRNRAAVSSSGANAR